ncbi:MAG: DnaA regulatory inactivator Hda [Methylococcaceae bacterium]|nr:DnaA regulatory inactivator Hda [Methylococcaceae bacterium]
MPVQVPLPFVFHGNQDFDTFFAGPNRQVIESLKAFLQSDQGDHLLFIRGESGLGKTHLLQASCRAASRIDRSAFYLPFQEWTKLSPDLLEGLENYHLVCVDDIDSIAGNPDWETAFFHFFNRHREKSKHLVVSARLPPQRLGIQLRDLASRLQSGLTLELKEMHDSDKLGALILKAKQLGFSLPQEVGRFLLKRYPRDLPSLWSFLETLDYASLSEQRKLTIPFLKNHLPE